MGMKKILLLGLTLYLVALVILSIGCSEKKSGDTLSSGKTDTPGSISPDDEFTYEGSAYLWVSYEGHFPSGKELNLQTVETSAKSIGMDVTRISTSIFTGPYRSKKKLLNDAQNLANSLAVPLSDFTVYEGPWPPKSNLFNAWQRRALPFSNKQEVYILVSYYNGDYDSVEDKQRQTEIKAKLLSTGFPAQEISILGPGGTKVILACGPYRTIKSAYRDATRIAEGTGNSLESMTLSEGRPEYDSFDYYKYFSSTGLKDIPDWRTTPIY